MGSKDPKGADTSKASSQAPRRPSRVGFWVVEAALLALIVHLWETPVVSPIRLLVVLIHEASHGLASVLTGGRIVGIRITALEAGLCRWEGGSLWIVTIAGYLGSALFGGLLLVVSARSFAARATLASVALSLFFLLPFAEDGFTLRFTLLVVVCFASGSLLKPNLARMALRFLGSASCLYVVLDVWHDLVQPGTVENDATVLARATGIAAPLSGFAWFAASLAVFVAALLLAERLRHPSEESA